MTINFINIRQWAEDKGIHHPDGVHRQFVKLGEEQGELAQSILKGDQAGIQDGIGDCVVVLTILAQQHGLKIEDCIQSVWDIISKRTGKTVDGVFVKDVQAGGEE